MRVAFSLVVYFTLLGCAGMDEYERFVLEKPPCSLPPLSEHEVLAIAKSVLGEWYSLQPEPNRRVVDLGCVYEYEQSLLSSHGKPDPLESLSPSASVLIRRDRSFLRISP
jgi:hypothetical protein